MGNDITAWRAAIGCFNNRIHGNFTKHSIRLNLDFYICMFLKFIYNGFVTILNFLIHILLLLCGDVETNPGPVHASVDVLSILHLNIRSLRNKIEFIYDNFLDFDILCFTETHLDDRVSDESLQISEKFGSLYRKDRTNHGGGVAVYISSSVSHRRLPCLENYCNESVWIELNLKSDKYLLGVFYSPITSDAAFFEKFNENLEKAFDISHNIMILGDFNEDLLNRNYHNFRHILTLNSLTNLITTPTRLNALLDPVLKTDDVLCTDSGVLSVPPGISDHKATFITIPFPYSLNNTFERTIWLYNKANFTLFNNLVSTFDWQVLLNGTVDEACTLFTDIFLSFAKSAIPSKIVQIRTDDKPWYDSEIRKWSRTRDRLKTAALKTGKNQDWQKYKNIRNKVNNLKKHAKESFMTNLDLSLTELQFDD